MQTRVELTYRFESAHRLPRVPPGHPCGTMHGHSYIVGIALEGTVDPEAGWISDFGDIDKIVQPVITAIDHQTLNEIEGLSNPTSENLAAWLWAKIKPALPLLTEVSVRETVHSRCVYTGK